MKILVVSDTHKKHSNLKKVLKKVSPIDLMIHLGDAEGHEEEIIQMAGCPVEIIAGNNDFFSNLEMEKELRIGRYKILLTHGHYYYVNMGVEAIRKEAMGRSFDIVMFGHTHKPMVDSGKNIIVVNPGSISYPRQEGRQASYIIMEIDSDGAADFTIHYI
jgi:putative phosphoesterase